MRRKLLLCGLITAVALCVLSACHGVTTVKTFVNRDNPAEKLVLESSSSMESGLFNTLHSNLQRFPGNYTLETASGKSTGRFEYAVNDKGKASYVFMPQEGKPWGVEVRADGSFEKDGRVWHLHAR
jgi:hypothetical protein